MFHNDPRTQNGEKYLCQSSFEFIFLLLKFFDLHSQFLQNADQTLYKYFNNKICSQAQECYQNRHQFFLYRTLDSISQSYQTKSCQKLEKDYKSIKQLFSLYYCLEKMMQLLSYLPYFFYVSNSMRLN